jgi:hypothetical protein
MLQLPTAVPPKQAVRMHHCLQIATSFITKCICIALGCRRDTNVADLICGCLRKLLAFVPHKQQDDLNFLRLQQGTQLLMRVARLPLVQAMMGAPHLIDALKQKAGSFTRFTSLPASGRGRLPSQLHVPAESALLAVQSTCKPRYQVWGHQTPLPSKGSCQQCRALSSSQGSSDTPGQPPEHSPSRSAGVVGWLLCLSYDNVQHLPHSTHSC